MLGLKALRHEAVEATTFLICRCQPQLKMNLGKFARYKADNKRKKKFGQTPYTVLKVIDRDAAFCRLFEELVFRAYGNAMNTFNNFS